MRYWVTNLCAVPSLKYLATNLKSKAGLTTSWLVRPSKKNYSRNQKKLSQITSKKIIPAIKTKLSCRAQGRCQGQAGMFYWAGSFRFGAKRKTFQFPTKRFHKGCKSCCYKKQAEGPRGKAQRLPLQCVPWKHHASHVLVSHQKTSQALKILLLHLLSTIYYLLSTICY